MECPRIEERLSEYMERTLPPEEMAEVARHLGTCDACAAMLEEMRYIQLACKSYPALEFSTKLLDRILLRTSGRTRTRTLSERLRESLVRPMMTPRFAFGSVLALLFVALSVGLMRPHMQNIGSSLSPASMVSRLERGIQGIYAEGLRFYGKKNEWQAQFGYFKNNMLNRLGFEIQRLDVPVQTDEKPKPGEPRQQQEKAPARKSSLLLLPV